MEPHKITNKTISFAGQSTQKVSSDASLVCFCSPPSDFTYYDQVENCVIGYTAAVYPGQTINITVVSVESAFSLVQTLVYTIVSNILAIEALSYGSDDDSRQIACCLIDGSGQVVHQISNNCTILK